MGARETVLVGGGPLTADEVVSVARFAAVVQPDPAALEAVAASRGVIDRLAGDVTAHYGVSTGFGALATRHIPPERRADLQRSLIRSHAAGSGSEVETEVVRALMLLRLSTMLTGRTGVRAVVAQTYAALLNAGIVPVVREHGSLGCSGDLAPLAHCALALMGEGPVRDASGELTDGRRRPRRGGHHPPYAEREGGAGAHQRHGRDARHARARDLRSARAADRRRRHGCDERRGPARHRPSVRRGPAARCVPRSDRPYRRPIMRAVLDGSPIVASHRGPEDPRVQDAYSLRCAPQVTGAARDTVEHAALVADRELAAAIDNPVVTVDGRVESNGNFHGAPIAYVLDFLAIVAADVASIAERRTDRFLDAARNHGLPPFLADRPGRRLGPDDRPVHPGGDRLRAQAPGRPRERGLDPVVRDAGGPRLDGLVGGAQAAAVDRRSDAGGGD